MEKTINICPHCKKGINPECITSVNMYDNMHAEIYICPVCKNHFFATTVHHLSIAGDSSAVLDIYPEHTFQERIFSDTICTVSPRFVLVYNQALKADLDGLNEISGGGYRKSLEILIKDFAAYLNPEKSDEIKQDNKLTNVINNRITAYVDLEDIKAFASRSWWLGCDESHYYQKYNPEDLAELKSCLDIVIEEIDHFLKKEKLRKQIQKK